MNSLLKKILDWRKSPYRLRRGSPPLLRWLGLGGLGLACVATIGLIQLSPVSAQSDGAVENQEDAVIEQYSLPRQAPPAPVVRPTPSRPARQSSPPAQSAPRPAAAPQPTGSRPAAPAEPAPAEPATPAEPEEPATETETAEPTTTETAAGSAPLSQYVLQFNRSPVVGNALQMEGILSQTRLGFTRPRHWDVESAKVQIRFRHSPALFADRSNLTVRINNAHLGSIPLNQEADEVGNALFDVPLELMNDYNTITLEAQQHTSQDCTDPKDPTLWTEILPDSRVIINYRPQSVPLDFASYPYPFVQELGLDADRLTYLRPSSVSDLWMTAAGRYQAAAARLSGFRPVQISMIDQLEDLEAGEPLVLIGTPAEQPALSELELPFELQGGKVLDGNGNALPDGVGVLMLTTAAEGQSPVLVATGNDSVGVLKAVQSMVQPGDRQLLTGQAVLVSEVNEIDSPETRDWPAYLPAKGKRLQLRDLKTASGEPFQDVTVNGLPAPPPVEIPLKALPDDRILRGSRFTLRYSYGPGIDPKRSSVSVRINDLGIGGKRLRSANGGSDVITLDVPPNLVSSDSTLAVQFFTYPNVPLACGEIPEQPLWGTVHGNSTLQLNRANVVQLPNLKLLTNGFPLAGPQDLSRLAFVMPDQPSNTALLTMLQMSSRLGRLSQADSVKLGVYSNQGLPENVKKEKHLVAIGERASFPLAEAQTSTENLRLGEGFLRRQGDTQVQTLPDEAGIIRAQVSPWNGERVLIGVTAQSEEGLADVRQLFFNDTLFSRLQGDTVLVQRRVEAPSIYQPTDYRVVTLEQDAPKTIDRRSLLGRAIAFFQTNWFLLPAGILLIALLLYGISQMYLNRLVKSGGA